MRLFDWVKEEAKRREVRVVDVVTTLEETSNVHRATIRTAIRGMKLKKYEIAKAVSEATRGEVTIAELCE